jgi:hypothetical protein
VQETEIQNRLKALGLYKGPVDGDIGPQSRIAIRAFQRSKKLRADSIIGPVTAKALVDATPSVKTPEVDVNPKPAPPAALTPEGKIRLYGPRLAKEFGLDIASNAAIWGNLGHESGLNPRAKGAGSDTGLAQWVGPRKRRLFAFAKQKGLDYHTFEAQFQFLIHELKGSESASVRAVKRPGNLMNKVVAFERAYERAGIKHYGSRHAWARRALKALS